MENYKQYPYDDHHDSERRSSSVLSPLNNKLAHNSLMSPSCTVKPPLQLPPPPPGLTGKDVEKWRKDMSKLLENQRKEEQRMEKLRAKEEEKSAQLEAKLKRKVEKLHQKYAGSSMPYPSTPPRGMQQQMSGPTYKIPEQYVSSSFASANPEVSAYALDAKDSSSLSSSSKPVEPELNPDNPINHPMEYPIKPDSFLSYVVDEPRQASIEEITSSQPIIRELNGEEEVRMVLAARKKRIDEIEALRREAADEDKIKAKDDEARRAQPLSVLLKQSRASYPSRSRSIPAPSGGDAAPMSPQDDILIDEIPASQIVITHAPGSNLSAMGAVSDGVVAYNVPVAPRNATVGGDASLGGVTPQSAQGSDGTGRKYGNNVGLGIYLGCLTSTWEYVVCGMVHNGPAAGSGVIRVNDVIDAIDGVILRGQNAESVDRLMHGPIGSNAHITFRRSTTSAHSVTGTSGDDFLELQAIITRTGAAVVENTPLVGKPQTPQKTQSQASTDGYAMGHARSASSSLPVTPARPTVQQQPLPVYSAHNPVKDVRGADGKCGVGLSFEMDTDAGTLKIRSMDASVKCPFQRGDEVISVESVMVKGNALLVPSLIWGEPGTAVQMKVQRGPDVVEANLMRLRTTEDTNILTTKGGVRTCGVGIVLEKELKTLFFYVKRVVTGGPAWSAGLQQGDMLLEIDGQDLRLLQKEDLPRLVVGPEGTLVRVKCLRGDDAEPSELLLTRSLDTAKVQSSNLAMRLRLILAPSCRDMATSATAQFAQALRADVIDALETVPKRVLTGRVTQGGREGTPVYASVVLLPDFEGSDARGVEDLVKELVYQASNPRSLLRQKPTTKEVERAEVVGQVVGDKDEPFAAEPQDYPEGYFGSRSAERDEERAQWAWEAEGEKEEDAPVHDLTISTECSDPSSLPDENGEQASPSVARAASESLLEDVVDKVNAGDEASYDDDGNDAVTIGRRMLAVLGHPLTSDAALIVTETMPVTPPGITAASGLMAVPVMREDKEEEEEAARHKAWTQNEAEKLRAKHPDRVPVVIKRAEFSDAPVLTESKFLARSDNKVEDFLRIIRKRMELAQTEVLFLINGRIRYQPGTPMFELYEEYKGPDGLLVMEYDLVKDYLSEAPAPLQSIMPPSVPVPLGGDHTEETTLLRRAHQSIEAQANLNLRAKGVIARAQMALGQTGLYVVEEEDEHETISPPQSMVIHRGGGLQSSDESMHMHSHTLSSSTRPHSGIPTHLPPGVISSTSRENGTPARGTPGLLSSSFTSQIESDTPLGGTPGVVSSASSSSSRTSWPPKIVRRKKEDAAGDAEDKDKEGRASVGRTAGVGMLIEAKRDGQGIRIAALAPGGPAERSGKVVVGDELVAVDGHSVKGKTTAHAATFLTGQAGHPVQLTIIRAGKLFTVTIDRGAAPLSSASASMQAERQAQLEEVSVALDAVQARLDDGYELPPVHDNFWEHIHIIKNFSLRARELLDECDCSIGHCNAQQRAVDEIAKLSMPSSDPALDKQHVFECAQISCRIMSMLEELEASKHRLLESEAFFHHRLQALDAQDEIIT